MIKVICQKQILCTVFGRFIASRSASSVTPSANKLLSHTALKGLVHHRQGSGATQARSKTSDRLGVSIVKEAIQDSVKQDLLQM